LNYSKAKDETMAMIKRCVPFLFCLCSLALAQDSILRPKAQFLINIDYSRARYNDTASYVEVSFGVYPGLVSVIPSSSGFHGAVDVRIMLRKAATGEMVAFDRMMLPIDVPDTSSSAQQVAHVGQSAFILPPETYKLDVFAVDSLTPSRQDSAMTYFEVKLFGSESGTSDVQLCTSIGPSSDKSDPFYKNSYKVVDNPSRVFSTVNSPVVYSYIELYNLTPGLIYVLKNQVLDDAGTVLRERVRKRQFTAKDAVDVTTLNINAVSSRKYHYVYSVNDTSGKEIVRSEKPIYVYNPSTKTVASGSVPMSVMLAGLSNEELQDEFEKAKYLMRMEDTKAFKPLTNAEAKRQFLSKFWSEVESGSRGWMDMTRTEYLRRVARANEKYSVMQKEGWKTDRGRVSIVYGNPEEVERYPDSEGRKPFEVWKYRNIEGGVDFVFADLTGYNNYILITSTKRGELNDPDWESKLHR
jgi:GWxTD domain-containing protein